MDARNASPWEDTWCMIEESDPRSALGIKPEHGASIAGLMITIECLVAEAPEMMEKAAAPTPPEDY